MSGIRYSDAKKKQIYVLYVEKGQSTASIARMKSMPTEKTVRRILTDQGVSLRGNPRLYDRPSILKDLKSNPVRVVAAKHGCSERFIYKLNRDGASEEPSTTQPKKSVSKKRSGK